jgi:hypothetical protein
MGFYELKNGCDSCDTVQSVLPNNVNMQMDPNSSLVASMVMPYGTQNNMVKQYNGAIASGYPASGSNMGYGGMGSSGTTLAGGAPTMVLTTTAAAPGTSQGGAKAVVATASTPVAVVVPSATTSNSASNNKANNKVEGFTDGVMHSDPRHWVVLGLVVFSALSLNECCKYFLNKSLQLNDGSPLYYVAYAGVAILLTWAIQNYVSKN